MRTKVGLIAVGLFGLAACIALLRQPGTGGESWMAACLRMGLVMSAAWLALPQLRQAPVWLLAGAGLICLVLARWPRYFVIALVIAIAAAIFRPRMMSRNKG